MTYILGAKCADGVILVADRKIILDGGALHEYEDKLFWAQPWMVVASSGTLGLFEKFRDKLTDYVHSTKYDAKVYNLTTEIENITRQLNDDYFEVLRGRQFDVLLGIQSTTEAVIKYIHPSGFAEGVRRYKVIGHGEPYGSFFMKYWWNRNMNMLEVAELGFFIIKCIQEFELDNTVGIGQGYPQIMIIPSEMDKEKGSADGKKKHTIRNLSSSELNNLAVKVEERLEKFKQQNLSWEIEHFLKKAEGGKE